MLFTARVLSHSRSQVASLEVLHSFSQSHAVRGAQSLKVIMLMNTDDLNSCCPLTSVIVWAQHEVKYRMLVIDFN